MILRKLCLRRGKQWLQNGFCLWSFVQIHHEMKFFFFFVGNRLNYYKCINRWTWSRWRFHVFFWSISFLKPTLPAVSQVSRAMRKWRFASWMECVWRLQFVTSYDRFLLAEGFFCWGFSILLCEEKGFAGGSKKDSDSLGWADSKSFLEVWCTFQANILTQLSNQVEVFKKWLRLGLPKSFELRWICCLGLHSSLTVQVVTKCLEVHSENVTRKTCWFFVDPSFSIHFPFMFFKAQTARGLPSLGCWNPFFHHLFWFKLDSFAPFSQRRWQQGFANTPFWCYPQRSWMS